MIGFIYKTTCLINDKIYIGQRVYTNDLKKDQEYLGSGSAFINSKRLYGKQNFKKEILKECNCFVGLNFWESFYIKKFDACNKEIGYNILTGASTGLFSINPGISLKGTKCSEEHKRKVSESKKGKSTKKTHEGAQTKS